MSEAFVFLRDADREPSGRSWTQDHADGEFLKSEPAALETSRLKNCSDKLFGRRWYVRVTPLAWLLAFLGCTAEEISHPPAVRPVKTMVVAAGSDVRIRTFPGTVEASRRVELAFQVSGLLVSLPVKEGDRVSQGDVIAQLRQDEFDARLATLQGQLDQARAELTALQMGERPEERLRREAQLRAAEARLANARTEYERHVQLLQRNVVTRSVYESVESAYRIAQEEHQAAVQLVAKGTIGREEDIQAMEGRVRGLEAQVVEANLQREDSTLLAPYDGVIAQRFVEEGQNVRAKDPIVRFQDVDEIEIAVDVPETVMASDIQRADIEQISAEISGAPGILFPVRIRELAQVADPTTQTFNVRVAMEAPENVRILPGMTATVTLAYRRASVLGDHLQVPVTAVDRTPAGDQVAWVLNDDGKVSSRAIQLGAASGSKIDVVDGLAPGDRVIVAGVGFLREGMEVRDLGDALGGGQP
ncbi:MAG: efflux RND transporter periplasmic adaptor subunit [Planctomycetaceae bacterium]|nr:efflux RND transporter periplasmic adaptor subunit [Planctomycetaceae bacterium]